MTLPQALYAHLLATAGLTALTSTRIYWGRRFQSTYRPAIVYNRVAGERLMSHTPANANKIETVWQFDIWADTPDTGRAVEQQLRRALETFPGGQVYDGSRFHSIEPGRDDFISEPTAEFRIIITAACWSQDD